MSLTTSCTRQSAAVKTRRFEVPGVDANGRVTLPNQWALHPAGIQLSLGDFPVNIAVHPSGQYAAILHAGYGEHEIIVVRVFESESAPTICSRAPLDVAFYGLIFSPDGRRIYASGGTRERIESFDFDSGSLSGQKSISVTSTPDEICVPAGMAISGDGSTLLVTCNRGHRVLAVDAKGERPPVVVAMPSGSFPYAAAIDESYGRAYVSLWGQAAVAVLRWPIDPQNSPLAIWPVQDHPNEMVLTRDGNTLYVANANRNTVSVLDTKSGKTLELLSSALFPNAPDGSTPNAIALSPDEHSLYVANATNNNLAVLDVSRRGQSRSLGFIPVGWYPTSERLTPDGRHLLVTNGKGGTPKANPKGPSPLRKASNLDEYIARLFRGTLSLIDVPDDEAERRRLTADAYSCSPLRSDQSPVLSRPRGNPIPGSVGGRSPIRYCIYIIKENRTYDQVLGDLPGGNGDPSLCLFGEEVTPNEHALAREFVLLDNFYVESEVSADGHEWSMGAYATDFVEKYWPLNYSERSFGRVPYPAEGALAITAPSEGYIWDRCSQAGVSYKSYGEFVRRGVDGQLHATVAGLEQHIDQEYEPYNLEYSDLKRAERIIAELQRYESVGDMPQMQFIHLPNDHTYGTRAGKPTPIAMVAENDLALGQIIEAISLSKFWPQTAIFVVEDDAQNGADHIDAHRTTAFVISPYARHGAIDSTLYSTTSMLRTMELILGLPPMSQFDAAARPIYASFQSRRDLRPYQHKPARVSFDTRNDATAWGANISESLDLSREDCADDLIFNEIIWKSVRGADSPCPAPVRAAFVISSGETNVDDDDD
ncbi:MAG: bifunctional YncE family protein/alkaline phosphatase family protein [Planctomycetes bacterium]|nr:bifunctional YncE family protein/alkaline phosphatase family protein [Planctomycetota bacterium]